MQQGPKKILKWVAIVGPIMGAIVTVAMGIMDIYDKYSAVSGKARAGYDTLAPALKEHRDIVNDTQTAVESNAVDLSELRDQFSRLDKRVVRCEAYMEVLSNQRRLPKPPPILHDKPQPTAAGAKRPMMRKPQRIVPDTIDEAKQFQRTRAELKCEADDPVCGALE